MTAVDIERSIAVLRSTGDTGDARLAERLTGELAARRLLAGPRLRPALVVAS